MKYKKGAMFGLDARIALAIFGALSVISGAALYSAIQNAKVTAIITELNEVAKAHEAYLLDTGLYLQLSTESTTTYQAIDRLVTNPDSLSTWKGPYLSYEKESSTDMRLNHTTYDKILIGKIDDDTGTWGGTQGTDYVAFTGCTAGSTTSCNYYTIIEYVPLAIAEAVDEQIDGSVNYKSGNLKIRYYPTGAEAGNATIYMKHMGVKI